jgi:hypothetical protein
LSKENCFKRAQGNSPQYPQLDKDRFSQQSLTGQASAQNGFLILPHPAQFIFSRKAHFLHTSPQRDSIMAGFPVQ